MTAIRIVAYATAITLIGSGAARAQEVVNGDWWHGGWGHMAYDGVFMLFGWGLLIVLAVVAVRYLARGWDGRPSSSRSRSPLDVLAERFAKGEIDEDEYQSKRRVLTEHSV